MIHRDRSLALGVRVVPTPHALRDPDWVARNPRARADDLMAAIAVGWMTPTRRGT
jgi:hypothetical protein